LSTADIDLFAVVAGPGSFTGLRIGIAAMQGLAVVHRRGIVAVSALLALGVGASETLAPGVLVGAWMDAHRGEVFSGLWRVTKAPRYSPGRLVEMDAPAVGAPGSILARWTNGGHRPAVIVGDGAVAYSAVVNDAAHVVDAPLLAPVVGLMALADPGAAVDPAAVQPIYVRRPDAEVARDALLQRTHATRGPAQ
jgi:tRNA threonylcarbamoyladenosine biosynthesis protein TsaB